MPKLPKKLNNACKLMEEDIEKIIQLRRQGYSQRFIAKKFGVSKTAIYYWLMSEKDRKYKNKDRMKYFKEKLKDPDFKENYKKIQRKSGKKQREYFRMYYRSAALKHYHEKYDANKKNKCENCGFVPIDKKQLVISKGQTICWNCSRLRMKFINQYTKNYEKI